MLKSGESRTLKDDQYLLDEKLLLWGRDRHDGGVGTNADDEDAQSQILPRGTHEFSFSFRLAGTQMPSSLETKAGTVRYYVKVIVDVPFASSPQGLKYFTLIGPHIDCMEEKYLTLLSAQDHRIRCFGCCKRGVVALRAALERSAYCCGEVLRLRLQLENRQYFPAVVCVSLIQHLEYRIDRGVAGTVSDTKSVQSTAFDWRSPLIQQHSQYRLEPGQEHALRVPVLPPTMLYYVLRLHVEEGGRKVSVLNMATAPPSSAATPSGAGNAALEMDFPLTVATVPFRPGHSQLYSVGYDFCVDHVETGKYISPEFRLGQVWDGRADGEKDFVDDVVLYRPVYVKVLDRTPNVAPFKTRESLPPLPPPSLQHLPNGANANHETNHPPTNFPPIENGH
uniref:Arrestin_N domain-containing protein n=1 Tax=Globodera pallida TaxID=36090 RepID=A0A183C351_GLOPA